MTADSSKIDSLVKILAQERRSGFRDSAVIGGLDIFLQRWAGELAPALGSVKSYSVLTPSERESWSEAVLERVRASAGPKPEDVPDRPAPRRRRSSKARARPREPVRLDSEVTLLKGVSKRNSTKLKRIGVRTIEDLINLFPHRHNDYSSIRTVSELEAGREQTVVASVWEAVLGGPGPRKRSTQAIIGDETGNVRCIWFNNPYMAQTLRPGMQVAVSGRVNVFRGSFVFESPDYEILQGQDSLVHTARLVPVYPSTEGLPQRTLRRLVDQALSLGLASIDEFLPDDIRHRTGLVGLRTAISQAHYPDSDRDWKAARRRLAFDELFLMQVAVLSRKRAWQDERQAVRLGEEHGVLDAFVESLPFALTAAQERVLREVVGDVATDKPMSRLLQGDVGSGKTVVAAAALLIAAANGYQAALMAPTEILAEQHFMTLSKLLSAAAKEDVEYLASARAGPSGMVVDVALILGSLPTQLKRDLTERVRSGSVGIVIGTHTLIQSSLEIPELALVVVDEQHRFGVMQRASLLEKGLRPHLLAMSATPIPRSLALTMYGDLDMSLIDELPPGRRKIRTRWVDQGNREAAYRFVAKEVSKGRQAFIVCPLVEESEAVQARAAIEEYERLSAEVFQDLRLGLLHGRMAMREKERVMGRFQRGELDILVSTPVIEVGIDVPNASTMLVDGADRFGLAQLHQFRGRVGRGSHESYCMLLADSPGEDARERLKIVERVDDGYELAEEDLRIRGPGDYMGTRQSGLPDLRVARISDQDILSLARREAARLLDTDPEMSREPNAALRDRFQRYTSALASEMS